MIMPRCACGYEVPKAELLKTDKQILTEIKREIRAVGYTSSSTTRCRKDTNLDGQHGHTSLSLECGLESWQFQASDARGAKLR